MNRWSRSQRARSSQSAAGPTIYWPSVSRDGDVSMLRLRVEIRRMNEQNELSEFNVRQRVILRRMVCAEPKVNNEHSAPLRDVSRYADLVWMRRTHLREFAGCQFGEC
jgi:hypothetical protein